MKTAKGKQVCSLLPEQSFRISVRGYGGPVTMTTRFFMTFKGGNLCNMGGTADIMRIFVPEIDKDFRDFFR